MQVWKCSIKRTIGMLPAFCFILLCVLLAVRPAEAAGTTVYKGVNYSRVYNYDYYVKRYPAVKKVCKTPEKVLAYFVTSGMTRHHRASASFDPVSYYNGNPALRKKFGKDWTKYYRHYMSTGYKLEKYRKTAVGIAHIWRKYKTAYYRVMQKAGGTLKGAFDWCAGKIRYYGKNAWQKAHMNDSIEYYADFGFKNNKGNCYVMAACFYEMAYELGYEVKMLTGYVAVGSRSSEFVTRMNGSWWSPHSWTEIKMSDGKWYVFDPDFTHESGKNGFKFRYGTPGTCRYAYYKEKKA